MSLTPWQFVHLLYGGAVPPNGAVEFRALGKGGNIMKRAWMPWPTWQGSGEEFHLTPRWRGLNAYVGVALRTVEGQQTEQGDKAHTHPTHLVWIDLDLKGTAYLGGDLEPEKLPPDELRAAARQALADILAVCEERGLRPRLVIYSGHGLQVYWAREVRSTPEDTEAYNRGLARLFEADPVSHDQARILRLPGTLNLKNSDRPIEVEVWHQDAGAVVPDSALEGLALRPQFTAASGERLQNSGTVSDADLEVLREAWKGLKERPVNGLGRHYLALHVSGWLRSNGYSEADAGTIVQNLAQSAGDEELSDRLRAVRESYRADNPKGWSSLVDPATGFGLALAGVPLKQAPAMTLTPGSSGKKQVSTKKLTLLEYAGLFLTYSHEHQYEYAYHEQWQRWFEYRGGVYHELLDATMRKRLDLVMQEEGHHDLKKSDLNEILLKVAHTPGIGKPAVDQGRWELNVANGVLDLHTLELREHSPDYLSVVQTAASWRPEATSSEWADFLTHAVPDREDRLLLQRYCGYCLTGDTSAQKALLLIGEGGTGKSTFTRVISAVLGGFHGQSLATTGDLDSLRGGTFIVGTLVGKRLCVISEVPRNVDWLPFKRIVGEDPISIDVKNKDAYTTRLDTKLIILSNVLPFLGEDAANTSLTRRFIPVSFNVRPLNPDPGLEARLVAPESLSGILTWMVNGLLALRRDGMRFSKNENSGLERQIIEQSNRTITFLEEACVSGGSVSHADLWTAYLRWCDDTRHRPYAANKFTESLRAGLATLGWEATQEKTRTGRDWKGFSLKGGGYL